MSESSKTCSFETIPLKIDNAIISIRDTVFGVCEVAKDPMKLEINVVYVPEGNIIEGISFRKYLQCLTKNSAFTIESFADKVFKDILNKMKLSHLVVLVQGFSDKHGPIKVLKATDTGMIEYIRGVLL